MAYVIGRLEGEIVNGKIDGEVNDLILYDGPRPKTAQEFGADPKQIERINSRIEGPINTLVRLGVGCALIVHGIQNLSWLSDEKQMDKVRQKIGGFKGMALLGARRNIQAGGTWLCQDICAGVLEEKDMLAGAIRELVEIGLYNDQGWAKYFLGPPYHVYQNIIEVEQEEAWGIAHRVWGGKPLTTVGMHNLAYDNINGMNCLVAGEPNVGSMEFIVVLVTALPDGNWKIRDLETGFSPVDNQTFLLDRQPLAIFPRERGKPIQLGFGPNGLDLNYPIIVLDKDNLAMNTNAKVQIVLDRLGWL